MKSTATVWSRPAPPQEIYEQPKSGLVVGFMDSSSTLDGRLVSAADGYGVANVGAQVHLRWRLPEGSAIGQAADVCVRTNAITVSGQNVLGAKVQHIQYFGETEKALLRAGGCTLKAPGLPGSAAPGSRLGMRLNAERCVAFPAVWP